MALDPFATPADLATSMQRPVEPGTAEAILDQTSAIVRSYCGWHIYPEIDDDVVIDGRGGRLLMLPSMRVVSVTAVLNDDVAITDYTMSAAGMLRQTGCWSREFSGITVSYRHGYEEPPAEIKAVVLDVATRAVAAPTGATSQTAGPFSVSWSKTGPDRAGGLVLMDTEQWVLDRYKLPSSP